VRQSTLTPWVTSFSVDSEAGHPAPSKDSHIGEHLALLAAYGGSTFNRTCSRRTFELKGRSMQTQDMLPLINDVFVEVFGGEDVRSDEAAEYFQDGGADYIQWARIEGEVVNCRNEVDVEMYPQQKSVAHMIEIEIALPVNRLALFDSLWAWLNVFVIDLNMTTVYLLVCRGKRGR
jgi:hypothetical protein